MFVFKININIKLRVYCHYFIRSLLLYQSQTVNIKITKYSVTNFQNLIGSILFLELTKI